jgi:hypothetical protein
VTMRFFDLLFALFHLGFSGHDLNTKLLKMFVK